MTSLSLDAGDDRVALWTAAETCAENILHGLEQEEKTNVSS